MLVRHGGARECLVQPIERPPPGMVHKNAVQKVEKTIACRPFDRPIASEGFIPDENFLTNNKEGMIIGPLSGASRLTRSLKIAQVSFRIIQTVRMIHADSCYKAVSDLLEN